jgi:hypothetical protein
MGFDNRALLASMSDNARRSAPGMETHPDYTRPKRQPARVTTTALRAYPGWTISHNHETGMYWARDDRPNGIAISAGHDTFAGALRFVRNGGTEV